MLFRSGIRPGDGHPQCRLPLHYSGSISLVSRGGVVSLFIGAGITPYWGMVIRIFDLHEFHGISKPGAVFAVFTPVVVFVVFYYLLITVLLFGSMIFLPA